MSSKILLKFFKYYWTFIEAPLHRFRKTPPPSARNLLIARFDGLGDFFLLVPHLQALAEKGFQITCIGPAFQKRICTYLSLDITCIPFVPGSFHELSQTVLEVQKQSFSHAFNLSMNAWGGIIVNRSFSAAKTGLLQEKEHYVYKGARLFYNKTESFDPTMHGFNVLTSVFANAIGDYSATPRIHRPHTDTGTVLIHPYANWKPRMWPGFPALIQRLAGDGIELKIIGTKDEHESSPATREVSHKVNCSIVTLDSIEHLLTEIDRAGYFIGNDSGPAHYAALIGKPTYVLWGPGYYERVRPLGTDVHIFIKPAACRPCRQRGDICSDGDNHCLRDIPVDEVFAAIRTRINERNDR
ncbi:MAG: hypothetical protein GF350_06135 [Chitinivibrionales bacterium]|nr:hypothetical protein [Chitinivibrionales bacterium]